jgi:hypothetical protein
MFSIIVNILDCAPSFLTAKIYAVFEEFERRGTRSFYGPVGKASTYDVVAMGKLTEGGLWASFEPSGFIRDSGSLAT